MTRTPETNYMLKFQSFTLGIKVRRGGKKGKGEISWKMETTKPMLLVASPLTLRMSGRKELYYRRMLLHHVKGPQSYARLKTINGELCSTYQDACTKLGLLEDDDEIIRTLDGAKHHCFGDQLRHVFCTILLTSRPADANGLWELYKDAFCEDKKGETTLVSQQSFIIMRSCCSSK